MSNKVTVFDLQSQTWVNVDAAEATAGIKEGRYEGVNTTVRTQTGSTGVRSVEDLQAAAAAGDVAAPDIAAQVMREALEAQRRAAFDTAGDKALTFAEGVVDAASLGLIHQTGESADIRREENSGSALLGQLVGTAASLGFGGPVRGVANAAGGAGKAAARAVLGEATAARAGGQIAVRAAEEAAIGAGLMGATAFGHQLTDAIIEDKQFAGEAVLHEMGLGAALGFGAGALSGGFKAAVSRGAIKGQGGLVDVASVESKALVDEIKGVHQSWRDAARQYEQRAQVLEVLHQRGVIPEELFVPYRDAAKAARRAVDQLDKYPFARAMDASPKEYEGFRKAMSDARRAIDDAGDVFMAPPSEARPQRFAIGQPAEAPGPVRTGNLTGGDDWSQGLDDMMMSDPRALEAYERLHGRPYEPIARPKIEGEGGIPGERFVDDAAAPTDKTAAGGKRKQQVIEEPQQQVIASGPGSVNRVNGGVTGAFERGELRTKVRPGRAADAADDAFARVPPSGEFTAVEQPFDTIASGKPSGMPWAPEAATGRFRLSDFSEDTLAGEGVGFRELNRQVDKGDWLNNAHGQRDLGLFPDGYMAPAKDLAQNGEAFARFRERAATRNAIAERELQAASPEVRPAGPATEQNWNVVKGDGNKTVKGGKPAAEADALGERTYKDPNVPRGEPVATPKKPKAAAEEAVLDPETGVFEPVEGKTQVRPKKGSPEWEEFQRRAAEDYIERWYWESKAQGPRINPADEVAVKMDQAMRRLSELSGGRLDSAGALEIAEYHGLRAADDMLVDRLDQVWALRKAARFAADEARGVATPLRANGRGVAEEWAGRYARMKMAAIGGAMGGPLGAAGGWVLGKHLPNMIGFGAKAASSTGKLMKLAAQTGESLLRGRRATVAARAIAGNRAYAYDDEGPIQDPVKRIQKIHRVAANPDQIRATVMNQLGDVGLAAPKMAEAIVESAVRQVQNLSANAPPVRFDVLGRPIMPTAGEMRKFYEYENSTHDVVGLLAAAQRGALTPTQALALAQQHVAIHGQIVKTLLSDPDVLAKKTTAHLRALEMVLQMPLTPASTDPGMVARTQASWAPPPTAAQPPARPQAFKITAQPPTPAQANAQGVAPGNETHQ